jgi:hypothetical protein
MPKIGKNHLIKKTKLVKTTTFATLLIAATLIFSSVGPATMVNNDVNVINEPEMGRLSTGGDGTTPSIPSEIMETHEKQQIVTNPYRGTIVWDNTLNYFALYRGEVGSGVTSELADDFMFSVDQKVNDVHWIGGYWGGTAETPWCIKFFEDAGNKPGDDFAGPFCFDWDEISKVPEGSYWLMNVDIPTVTFSGGQKYWIAIYAEGSADPPYAGWAAHLSPIILHEGLWRWPEYGYNDWTPTGTITGYGPADFAFQLTAKADNDVGIASIDAPTDLQELCGCLPVAVTAENYGIEDADDVPVQVEIRRTIFENGFEEGALGIVWDIDGLDCGWSITSVDTGNPSVVSPHSGDFMAELNSGNGGAGGSCLLYEIVPQNLEEFCNPWMSFYMWHDAYGSDDDLEVWVNPGTGWQFVAGPYTRLCCPGCPTGWQQHIVSLQAFAGLPFVQIGFVGYCDGNPSAYNLHIDTVTKYDQEFFGEEIVDIPVGETVEVEFDEEWCPCLYGEIFNTYLDFEIIACTAWEDDEIPANNCMDDIITLYFPYEIDIAAISIDEPTEPIAGPNPMVGTIKNTGQTEQCCFKAKMSVQSVSKFEFWEEFDEWEDNPEGSYYTTDDRPVGWRDIGTYYSDLGWEDYNTNYAGGEAPEATLYWGYARYYVDNILESPSLNTLGYDSLELEYKSYIDWYSGSTYCNMYVEIWDGSTWTDITPWANPISGNVGPDTYTHDIGAFASSDMKVRYRFYGYYFYFDYWRVDDFKVIGTTYGDVEYFEEVCVDCIDVCEEQTLTFPDWTPAQPWPDCGTNFYVISLLVNPCDPEDDYTGNNQIWKEVSVDFWRDIELEFSSPAPGAKGDLLYDNGEPDGRNGLAGSMYAGYDNRLIDDFTPDDDWTITDGHFSFVWNTQTSINIDSVKVFFYLDEGGCSPSLTEYAEPAVSSFEGEHTGNSYFGRPEVAVDVEFAPVTAENGQTYFVGFQVAGSVDDIAYMLTAASKGCQLFADLPYWGYPRWSSSSYLWGEEYDLAYKLTGTIGFTPGPPVPDVYVPCGEQDLCVNLINNGDQPESVDVFMELYEFVTDPTTPTLAATGTADNVAVAVGATEEVCFGTFDFAEAGVYWMLAEAIVEGMIEDCDPTNNDGDIGIGVDCCPPTSMHYPDPMYPNGDNNWYTRSVDVEITATDPLCPDPCWGTASGVKEIRYTINSGSEVVVPGESTDFKLTDDGVHLVEYYAVDFAGNEEDPFTFEIAIDKTAPSVDMFYTVYQDEAGAWHVDFEIAATDATSGNAGVKCYIGTTLDKEYAAPPYDTWTVDWIPDYSSEDFKAEAFDNAGNSDDVSIPGEQIDDEIHARSHSTAHTVLSARAKSVLHSQQPRSR